MHREVCRMNAQMTELTSKARTKPTHTAGSFHEKRVGRPAPPRPAPRLVGLSHAGRAAALGKVGGRCGASLKRTAARTAGCVVFVLAPEMRREVRGEGDEA